MNTTEARFLLRAYRPNGSDAADPTFREALELTRQDPALGAWFRREQAADQSVADHLAAIMPPPGLREAILAGSRVSRRRTRSTFLWLGALAAAACITILAMVSRPGSVSPTDTLASLANDAMRDTRDEHGEHQGYTSGLRPLQARLENLSTRIAQGLNIDTDALRAAGCRTVEIGGHEVFELCFERDGVFHLYVTRRSEAIPARETPMFIEQGQLAAATWSDDRYAYVLTTDSGADNLRAVL